MSVETEIREYLNQYLLFSDDAFEYDDDDSFLENGIVDSVAVMELALFVEEKYNIVVDDHEITPDNFDSVNKLARYVRSRLNGSAAA
ncbi:MAG: acyl carrier protein [Chloroflexi bacterium]|nr:acyl carrier protein [Chloroflexota bacterium]